MKDAVRDGLRAVKNAIDDQCVVPGAGAFEAAANVMLKNFMNSVAGRAKLGVAAFADALLVIPKTLASNSGLDTQEALIELLNEASKGNKVGIDVNTGRCLIPSEQGIWDNFVVKRQFLQLGSIIAHKLLIVDEIMRAGRNMGKD